MARWGFRPHHDRRRRRRRREVRITKNNPDGAVVAGFPNIDIREWKMWVLLPAYMIMSRDQVSAKVEELEKG